MTWATNGDMMRDLRAHAYDDALRLRGERPTRPELAQPTYVMRRIAAELPALSVRASMRATTPKQRRPASGPRAPVAACGTESGYHRHKRRGEPYCEACREAHAAAARASRRRAAS